MRIYVYLYVSMNLYLSLLIVSAACVRPPVALLLHSIYMCIHMYQYVFEYLYTVSLHTYSYSVHVYHITVHHFVACRHSWHAPLFANSRPSPHSPVVSLTRNTVYPWQWRRALVVPRGEHSCLTPGAVLVAPPPRPHVVHRCTCAACNSSRGWIPHPTTPHVWCWLQREPTYVQSRASITYTIMWSYVWPANTCNQSNIWNATQITATWISIHKTMCY